MAGFTNTELRKRLMLDWVPKFNHDFVNMIVMNGMCPSPPPAPQAPPFDVEDEVPEFDEEEADVPGPMFQ